MTQSRDTARSNLLWIADLEAPENKEIGAGLKWTKVVDEWGSSWSDVANDGSKLCVCAFSLSLSLSSSSSSASASS